MSNEVIPSMQLELLPIKSVSEFFVMGELLAQCKMLGATNPAEGFIIATTCHQQRMSFLEFGETYNLIQGNLSMRADAMLARLLQFGGEYEILERTPEMASIKATFRKATGTFSFSWKEAQEERFPYAKGGKALKDNWATPRGRKQMLWARCVSDAVRTICPLANKGSYTPEEVHDFDDNDETATTVETVVDPTTLNKGKAKDKPPVGEFVPAETKFITINQPATDIPPNLDAVANMPAAEPAPEPKPIEVQAQVQTVPDAESPFTHTEADVNADICPIGKEQGLEGRLWKDLPKDNLQFAFDNWKQLTDMNPGKLTDAHKAAVEAALGGK